MWTKTYMRQVFFVVVLALLLPFSCGTQAAKGSDVLEPEYSAAELLDPAALDTASRPSATTDTYETVDTVAETETIPYYPGGPDDPNCHTDCFGGLECRDGTMVVALFAPIPCWVERSPDCFDHGEFEWNCASGTCADSGDLCAEDHAHLLSLVPPETPWPSGYLRVERVGTGKDASQINCWRDESTWELRDEEAQAIFRLSLPAVESLETAPIASTSNLFRLTLDLDDGGTSPVDFHIDDPTAETSTPQSMIMPLRPQNQASSIIQPLRSGALSLVNPAGDTTIFVWRATNPYTSQVVYAILTPEPEQSRRQRQF